MAGHEKKGDELFFWKNIKEISDLSKPKHNFKDFLPFVTLAFQIQIKQIFFIAFSQLLLHTVHPCCNEIPVYSKYDNTANGLYFSF